MKKYSILFTNLFIYANALSFVRATEPKTSVADTLATINFLFTCFLDFIFDFIIFFIFSKMHLQVYRLAVVRVVLILILRGSQIEKSWHFVRVL